MKNQEESNLFRDGLRPRDSIGRFGGDEFVALIEDVSESGALDVAERIQEQLRQPFEVDSRPIQVGASIGIAMNRVITDTEALIQAADAAMYRAKKNNPGICTIGNQA